MKTRLIVTFGSVLVLSALSGGMAHAQEPVRQGRVALLQAPSELAADAPDLGRFTLAFVPGELPLSTAVNHPQPPYSFPASALGLSQAQWSGDPRQQDARMFVERMSRDWKHRVEITLRNGTLLQGRVVAVAEQQFTIRAAKTKHETTVSYADLWDWYVFPTSGEIARNVLAVAGLELAQIALLPLLILAALSGWDGC